MPSIKVAERLQKDFYDTWRIKVVPSDGTEPSKIEACPWHTVNGAHKFFAGQFIGNRSITNMQGTACFPGEQTFHITHFGISVQFSDPKLYALFFHNTIFTVYIGDKNRLEVTGDVFAAPHTWVTSEEMRYRASVDRSDINSQENLSDFNLVSKGDKLVSPEYQRNPRAIFPASKKPSRKIKTNRYDLISNPIPKESNRWAIPQMSYEGGFAAFLPLMRKLCIPPRMHIYVIFDVKNDFRNAIMTQIKSLQPGFSFFIRPILRGLLTRDIL